MKKCIRLIMICMLTFIFAACGEQTVMEDISVTSIELSSDGEVRYHLIDSFDKAYYSLTELEKMASTEVDEYNSFKGNKEENAVRIESVGLLPTDASKVEIIYCFRNADSFSDFDENSLLYYGTVNEAVAHGYKFDEAIKSSKDGSVLSKDQLEKYGEKKVIIIDSKLKLYIDSRVLGISEGLSVSEGGSIDLTSHEGKAYIILK